MDVKSCSEIFQCHTTCRLDLSQCHNMFILNKFYCILLLTVVRGPWPQCCSLGQIPASPPTSPYRWLLHQHKDMLHRLCPLDRFQLQSSRTQEAGLWIPRVLALVQVRTYSRSPPILWGFRPIRQCFHHPWSASPVVLGGFAPRLRGTA